GLDIAFLHRVLRLLLVAQDAPGSAIEAAVVAPHQDRQPLRIAAQHARDQHPLVLSRRPGGLHPRHPAPPAASCCLTCSIAPLASPPVTEARGAARMRAASAPPEQAASTMHPTGHAARKTAPLLTPGSPQAKRG